jgi:outer membrane protein TolC
MTEPESIVLKLLREMRAEMATKDDIARLDAKIDDTRSEVRSLAADVASDMLTLENRLGEQIAALRRAVMEYHSSAIGHGVLISEFEERLRKVEQRLDMSPSDH